MPRDVLAPQAHRMSLPWRLPPGAPGRIDIELVRECSRCAATDLAMPGNEGQQTDRFVDEADVEIELERKELIELLDRALTSLPTAPREALIAQYVWDLPLSGIASRAGISVPAATMRVQRAKVALQTTTAPYCLPALPAFPHVTERSSTPVGKSGAT
jgi:predicted RNA polymerase sigma factor